MTTPSPATIPGAGLPHVQAAIRRADGNDTPLPPTVTAAIDRAQEIRHQAERDTAHVAPPRPPLPNGYVPPPTLSRDQHIRRIALEAAVQYFTNLAESDEDDVLATAKTWAEWIRTGL